MDRMPRTAVIATRSGLGYSAPRVCRVVTLQSPRQLGVDTVSALLRGIDLLAPPDGEVEIDCTDLTFITPSGMAALLGIIDVLWRSEKDRRIQFRDSALDSVNAYMQRMGLFQLLGLPEPERRYRDRRLELCELRRLSHQSEVTPIVEHLIGIASSQLDLGAGVADAINLSLGEVLENVPAHAQSPTPGYVCAQTYRRSRRVEFAIVDTGIGILGSARDVADLRGATHADAIGWAINRGSTSKPGPHSGIGLFMARRMIQDNRGTMWVYSGEAAVKVSRDKVEPTGASGWPGTIVTLTFRTDRPINVESVLEKDFGPADENELVWG